jgi:hypothetical protein
MLDDNEKQKLKKGFCFLSFHAHREGSILAGELPEESEQFRFLRASRLANLKDSLGLILGKVSTMWVTIPIDLSLRKDKVSVCEARKSLSL